MIIHQTITYFIEKFKPTAEFVIQYQQEYAIHFEEYFRYHCRQPEEKLKVALTKYPEKLPDIVEINGKIVGLIEEVKAYYEMNYDITFEKDVHLIVGMYGSNAFTHRQINPEITFCLEKLSPKEEHLCVIISHEFGHALHNLLSDHVGMNWKELDWNHPYTWLLQEGSATYFSTKAVTTDDPSVYFTYDDDEEGWLRFAESNRDDILKAFQADLQVLSPTELFREWFSINGGTKFSKTRLAYYIGYHLLLFLIGKMGEQEAVTAWKRPDFHSIMSQTLEELDNQWSING
ncbi:hypothetical protein ACFOZY_00040 [Chungangia koreensis]|uniref:Aminopeptidase n=1 Tax=Chungangia koreensis TaxID=752657 RepID=A0ABV8WYU9_9LACT